MEWVLYATVTLVITNGGRGMGKHPREVQCLLQVQEPWFITQILWLFGLISFLIGAGLFLVIAKVYAVLVYREPLRRRNPTAR